jgi:hypothetical protein
MNEEQMVAFVRKATEYYRARLAEEKELFGVRGISTTFVENNSSKVVEHEHAGILWEQLSKQSGLFLEVGYAGDPQVVYAILSMDRVLRSSQLVNLYMLVEDLGDGVDLSEKLDSLEIYEGPYKLPVPDDL